MNEWVVLDTKTSELHVVKADKKFLMVGVQVLLDARLEMLYDIPKGQIEVLSEL